MITPPVPRIGPSAPRPRRACSLVSPSRSTSWWSGLLPSVLVGDFGPVMRVGLVEVLADGRIECVGESPRTRDLLSRLDDTAPDAVVINWDDRRSEAVMASLHTRRPEITVIACSSNRLAMLVRPGETSDGATHELSLSADGLVEAVRTASVR